MRMKAVCGLLFLVLLAACAQVPRPSTYPYNFQQQMQAADHWHLLASQVAEGLAASRRGGVVSSREPVYIRSDDRSPFGQAFRGFLITELTKQGIPVSSTQDTPLQIDWDVQRVIHHADRRKPPLPLGWLTGLLAALTVSPFVNVSPVIDTGPLPHSEVIITTMITRPDAMLSRNSDVYYINGTDWQHYWSPAPLVQKAYAVVDR